MKSDELVLLLATGVEPVERHPVGRRHAVAVGLGLIGAGALMLMLLGLRPDLAEVVRLPMFWVKLAFVAGLAWTSLLAAMRLSRPGMGLAWVPAALVAPALAIWAIAAFVLADTAPVEVARAALWGDVDVLSLAHRAVSVPAFVALFWAMPDWHRPNCR